MGRLSRALLPVLETLRAPSRVRSAPRTPLPRPKHYGTPNPDPLPDAFKRPPVKRDKHQRSTPAPRPSKRPRAAARQARATNAPKRRNEDPQPSAKKPRRETQIQTTLFFAPPPLLLQAEPHQHREAAHTHTHRTAPRHCSVPLTRSSFKHLCSHPPKPLRSATATLTEKGSSL